MSAVRLSAVWCACLLILLVLPATRAGAQVLPTSPITAAGGRLTIGAEASASISPDDPHYFDYSGYDYNLMRQLRVDGSAAFRLGEHLALLGDLRVEGGLGEGGWRVRPYAAFVRVRPWSGRAFDVQAGLIPPVFGAFSRRAYGADNPLIGFPLGYQYLTSLRPDALPATADDLLRMRGRGWQVSYPVGNGYYENGVPLVDGLHYQTGVEVHAGNEPIAASFAVTAGSLSAPQESNPGASPQVSGRLAYTPVPGVHLGVSFARATFLSKSLGDAVGATAGSGDQRVLGADVEYSAGYFLVRSEMIFSTWRLPALGAPFIDTPLRALAIDVEGRYRLSPGLYVAARVDHIGFNDITGTFGTLPWDAPVRRFEVGGGYSLQRNVLLKLAYQYNRRDTRIPGPGTAGLASAQILVWF